MTKMKKICRLLFLTAYAIYLPFTVHAQRSTVGAKSLDKQIETLILRDFADASGPGGVFMVAHQGRAIYKKAFGKANMELGIALTSENVFQLGSMTKQFTAVAILMLEQEGKLDVNDPVSKYIPDYPKGQKITIHQLLTHTSGIKDFTKMKSLADIAQKEMTPKMMVDFFKNEPVDFLPGEKFDYNNSGYVLLGYLIELISGERYEDFIVKHIFDKIGMGQSYYASDRKVISKRAYGYHKKSSGYVNKTAISFSVPFSSGSLMSTTDDLLKWQNAINHNLLLNEKEKESAFSKHKLNNGQEFGYGYGWHVRAIDDVKTLEHGGSIFGFKTMVIYIPEEDIYVVGLSNCDCNSPTKVVGDIAALMLKIRIEPAN
ncbi:beta-lactamase [Pedobacter sp. BAL39]|uniref:serine hydrolase domain-containing protein n=1 Tax=Pedobacter sp. BAL39 TaxID=391596 RepID=UPI0001559584|nr:serine hydrolase domain-containing protein [Pedobacter sp. BAL39]EDM34808.1 beta-lactamase [Pedobacter sp. BAL39]